MRKRKRNDQENSENKVRKHDSDVSISATPSLLDWSLRWVGIYTFSASSLYDAIALGDLATIHQITQHYFKPSYRNTQACGPLNVLAEASKNREIFECILNIYWQELSPELEKEALNLCLQTKSFDMFFQFSAHYYLEESIKTCEMLVNANISYIAHGELYNVLLASATYCRSELTDAFILLHKESISYHENEPLYNALINNAYASPTLAKAFILLHKENISYHENELLYNALINTPFNSSPLAKAFILLHKENITYDENQALYNALINTPHNSSMLKKAFILLHKENITYHENQALYNDLVQSAHFSSALAKAFILLHKENITYHENQALYNDLVKSTYFSPTLAKSFILLHKENITYHENRALYNAIAKEKYYYTVELVAALFLLHKENITYHENEPLYNALVNTPRYSSKLADAFILLHKENITYRENQEFYNAIIKKSHCVEELITAFSLLHKKNITYHDNELLYQYVVKTESNLSEINFLYNVFTLKKLELCFQENPQFVPTFSFFDNVNIAVHISNQLINAGYSVIQHKTFFNRLLNELCHNQPNRILLFTITQALCDYAATHTLLSQEDLIFETQFNELNNMIEEYFSSPASYVEGPLNKSRSTTAIEQLLENIIQNGLPIKWIKGEHHIITTADQKTINLSLLIRNSNLSQLMLNEETLDKIDAILQEIITFDYNDSEDFILSLLSKAEHHAFLIYFSASYRNINRLFRNEPLDPDPDLQFSNNNKLNKLACFLLGCILNNAANKIRYLVDQLPTKQILDRLAYQYDVNISDYTNNHDNLSALLEKAQQDGFLTAEDRALIQFSTLVDLYPRANLLDRGEKLTDEIIQRRIANVWTVPALTSFSARHNGSPYFHKEGTKRTKLENAPHSYIVNSSEGEVVFPHGEQIKTFYGPEGQLISRIIRSPSFEQKNHYWSELALLNAFQHYLSKEYAEHSSAIMIDGKQIVRPNHNMTHVYRVMLNIQFVLDYFTMHAKDKEFKDFCQCISDDKVEWLRVAAAFSITGRESEISAMENLQRYDEYREACAMHFNTFVEQSLEPHRIKRSMQERMTHIVRYMGNPHYEGSEQQPGINCIDDAQERKLRNFYHRILTIAHKLDLPRCYSAEEYESAMAMCLALSEKNAAQQAAFFQLVHYNVELIKAHGATLHCDILPTGELQNTYAPYQNIYAQSSTSVKRLFEITETVPRPSGSRFLI